MTIEAPTAIDTASTETTESYRAAAGGAHCLFIEVEHRRGDYKSAMSDYGRSVVAATVRW